MSFVKFDSIIDTLRAQGASFEDAMDEAKKAFGLITADDPDAGNAAYANLILTDYELEGLRAAYQRSMTVGAAGQDDMTQRDYELYGTYQPFSVELCHVLNHKSGMDHTTWSHTGAPVNLYAVGAGSEKRRVLSQGIFENRGGVQNPEPGKRTRFLPVVELVRQNRIFVSGVGSRNPGGESVEEHETELEDRSRGLSREIDYT